MGFVCGIVCHTLIYDVAGRLFCSRTSDNNHMNLSDLPKGLLSGSDTPDHTSISVVEETLGITDFTLMGGFTHNIQLPDAPVMLTIPTALFRMDDALHLIYSARIGRFAMESADDKWWRHIEHIGLPDGRTLDISPPSRPGHDRASISDLRMSGDADLSTAVFVNRDGLTLLHPHPKARIWLPPGGHVESGESLTRTALREVEEETGITVVLEGFPSAQETGGIPRITLIPRPRGVQIERLGDGHEHLDFVYFSRPAYESIPYVPFEWLGLEEAHGKGITDEMGLWCEIACR